MGIISSLDSQSLQLTRKLLQHHYPSLATELENEQHSFSPLDETTIELEVETVNHVIDSLIKIGQHWLSEVESPYLEDRQKILSRLLQQWINVGEHTKHLTSRPSINITH